MKLSHPIFDRIKPPVALAVLCALIAGAAAEPEPKLEQLRFFFSKRVIFDTKDNGARVAVKAWAQSVIKETGMQAEALAEIGSVPEGIAAFREGRADVASLPTDEFFKIAEQVEMSDIFIPISESGAFEEYLLIVRADSGITNLSQLRGKKLIMHEHHRMVLASMWLETILAKESLGTAETFFTLLRRENKAPNVVLPVFFRASEACVVTRRSFALAAEMNPQVGSQLRVLCASPKVIPTLLCFSARSRTPFAMRAREATRDLHKTVYGQQILTTFQVYQMREGSLDQLDSTRALINEYERCDGARGGKPAPVNTALNNTETK